MCVFNLFVTDAGVGDSVCLLASSLTPSIMREITAQKITPWSKSVTKSDTEQ